MHMRRVSSLLLFSLLAASPAVAQEYSFGVIPQMSPAKLAQAWGPLLDKVGKEAGVKLRFATAPTISEFDDRLVMSGKSDFIWTNPLMYVTAAQKHRYAVFAHEAKNKLQGIVVVAASSPAKSIADLKGKKIAVPGGAFAAESLVEGDLAKAGILPGKDIEVRTVTTHDNAYLMVASGQTDAAGGVMRTYKSLAADAQRNLRILYTTDPVTPHAFAANPRVPADVVKRVRDALLKVGSDPANADMLANLKFAAGFEASQDSDYDDARKIQAALSGQVAPKADGGK